MTDNTEKRELAQEAAILLSKEHVFGKAVLAVRRQWFDELIGTQIGSQDAVALHSKLKALDEVTSQLTIFITDYKMAQGRAK